MKIDKRNLGHWLLLLAFMAQGVLGLLGRLALRSRGGRRPDGIVVVLYGHKLNGNLLAIHRYVVANPQLCIRATFLTMDRGYARELAGQGVDVCEADGPGCARLLARADALISDHGLHSLQPFVGCFRRLGLRFFDVWHGIPFKGFDGQDFRVQHGYDEVWVASERCRRLYVERFGFPPGRVKVTGYARTDRLLRPEAEAGALRAALGLPGEGRLILFAPTWAQDASGRSLYPFGLDEQTFLRALTEVAGRHGATVLLRSHLNSGDVGRDGGLPAGVRALPSTRYPDTESILLVSDVLICDWSSIAFDYLLLDRPTLFLDVPPPFRKGFSLGPEYRFGEVAGDMDALLRSLEVCLGAPDRYWQTHRSRHADVMERVYGDVLDGRASERCVGRLVGCVTGEGTPPAPVQGG